MGYADLEDVKQRLGRYAPILAASGSQQHPNEDDVTELLDDVSAEIDNAIDARGFDPTQLDQSALAALKDLTVFGAIDRLLAGVPMDSDLEKAATYARKVWVAAFGDPTATSPRAVDGTFRSGTHPVIAALESGRAGGGAGSSAGSFWGDVPEYGTAGYIDAQAAAEAAGTLPPSQLPGFSRGMSG